MRRCLSAAAVLVFIIPIIGGANDAPAFASADTAPAAFTAAAAFPTVVESSERYLVLDGFDDFDFEYGEFSDGRGDLRENGYREYAPAKARAESVTVCFNGKKKNFDFTKFLYDGSSYAEQSEADRYGRLEGYTARRETMRKILAAGGKGIHAFRFMFAGFTEAVEAHLAKHFDIPPKDARLVFRPSDSVKFAIIKEQVGYSVNREKLFDDMLKKYCASPSFELTASALPVEAEIKSESLKDFTYLRSAFSTSYASSSAQRKHNVSYALSRFNGMRVDPGGTVSFNKVVGPRTVANGFLEAKIIVSGRFEDGIGGGVCQSSTTLYNAALLADMEILAAQQHSLPISYIEPSFDAMVNSSSSDLIFKNNSRGAVFLRTYAKGERVYVEFYGEKLPYRIVRRSETLTTIPHAGYDTFPDTEKKYSAYVRYKGEYHIATYAKDGLTSRGYLQYYSGKQLIHEKHIRTNKYAPVKGVIYEGTESPPPPPPPQYLPEYEWDW